MARINKDSVDHFYDYDVNLSTRTLYMGSAAVDFDEESGTDATMAERMIKGLHLLDTGAPTGDKPITIIMNNLGGDFTHGMAIFDAIKACKNHVTVKVFGYAMSMGSIIMQAADERILSPNSEVMIHFGTMGMGSTHTKIFQKWAEHCKRTDKKMIDIYLEKIQQKHPNFKRSKVEELCNFDTILSAQEAVDLGLADKVE